MFIRQTDWTASNEGSLEKLLC